MTEREPLPLGETLEYGELFNAEDDELQPPKTTKKNDSNSWLSRLKPKFEVDESLLVYKVFYFFYFAAIGSLQPYLALYFKHSLQLPAHLVGLVIGVRPFCLFVSAPILGTIADKYQKVRAVLVLALFSYTVSSLLVTVVPPVTLSCLSEVHNKLNVTTNSSIVLHGNTTVFKQKNLLTNALNNHRKEQKKHLQIKERGNMEIWKESWMFDLYRRLDHKTFEKARVIFTVVMTITIVGELLGATSNTLADVATLQNLGNQPTDYGELRLWGAIGWGIAAFITGNIVTRQYRMQTDICPDQVFDIYRPLFYIYASLMTISLFVASRFKFGDAEKHLGERCALIKGLQVFTHLEYILFAAITVFLGIAFGSSEAFLGIHLLNLGATPSLLSALVGVQCLSNMTLYYASVYLIKSCGQMRMLCVGLAMYVVRFYYFSAITNAWLVLPIEFLCGICQALVWSSLVSYVATPPRIGATLQGILHGLYYGLGRGLGQVIGGILIQKYGGAHFFSFFALIVLFILLVFIFIAPLLNFKKTIWMRLSGYSPLDESDEQNKLSYVQQIVLFWRGKRD